MRAVKIIQKQLEKGMGFMHAARREALWRAVEAVIVGKQLWVTALGRSRPGATDPKHGIKAIDRLLGNRHLRREQRAIYAALVQVVLGRVTHAVILVDETEIRPGVCALSASLACDGRGLPIYSIVRTKRTITKHRCRLRFLHGLNAVLPTGVVPTLITDAGFEAPWFDAVTALGWHYVGRVRGLTQFRDSLGTWQTCQALHSRALFRPRALGLLAFPKRSPKQRRCIVSQRPRLKGRTRRTTRGTQRRSSDDARFSKSAREPWLLATSLAASPRRVVRLYALRMQIEQNYRDTKNHRFGFALKNTRSRSHARLELLLLLAALASLILLSVGCAAEKQQLQSRFQANSLRKRRVLSLFVLGGFLLLPTHRHRLSSSQLYHGFLLLSLQIQSLEILVT